MFESTNLSHWPPPTPGKHEHSPVIALHEGLTEPPTLHEQPETTERDTNTSYKLFELLSTGKGFHCNVRSEIMIED